MANILLSNEGLVFGMWDAYNDWGASIHIHVVSALIGFDFNSCLDAVLSRGVNESMCVCVCVCVGGCALVSGVCASIIWICHLYLFC